MMIYLLAWLIALFSVQPVLATIYWAESAGSNSIACTSIDSTSPDDDPGVYGTIGRAANCATQPGDRVYILPGTYTSSNHKIDTETTTPNFASGTSESVRMIISGVPGMARPQINVTSPFIQFRGNATANTRNWVTIENLNVTDTSVGSGGSCIFQVIGNHIRIQHANIADAWSEAICTHRADVVPVTSDLHLNDLHVTNPGRDGLGYSLYGSGTDDVLVENSYLEGLQQVLQFTSSVPGQFPKRPVIRNNYLKGLNHNGLCNGIASESPGTLVYNNIFEGCTGGATNGAAIVIGYNGNQGQSLEAYNNTIFNWKASGIQVGLFNVSGPTTAIIRNNYFYNNGNGTTLACYQTFNSTTVTIDHNAAVSGTSSCGTNKVTITDLSSAFVSSSDLRLKLGTNPAVDAGVSVQTRTIFAGSAPDIGHMERGEIVSAVFSNGTLELTVQSIASITPASNITGLTIQNGTSTGTPVVDSSLVLPGSTNIIQATVSGFATNGTCTVSYSSGNLKDTHYVGTLTTALSQDVNTVSSLAAIGTCANTGGGPPPTTGLLLHHKVDEGSGSSLGDETVNNNDSTLSGSPTWTTSSISGSALYFPNDSVDRRATLPLGNGINASSQSFTVCVFVKPDAGMSNKIVIGPSLGSNMRMYAGSATGQTWQLGVGSSSYSSTGESAFPVTTNYTQLCIVNDSSTDIATLFVNGQKGVGAAVVKSSASVTSLASNFLIGCGFSGTNYCGGYTIDEPKYWNVALSESEILDNYASYFPSGGPVGGYTEATHRWQAVYLDGASNPINLQAVGTQEIEVIAGGAVTIEFQVNCTGANCDPLAVRLHASDITGNTGPVPQEFDALGLAMWRSSASSILNRGVSTCCLSGALTPVNGVTILDSVASNTITLAQDSSTMFRFIVRVATDQVGELYTLFLKQDNGAALDGAAGTTPQIRVVPPRVGTGF